VTLTTIGQRAEWFFDGSSWVLTPGA